jgi:hypothetical protein
VDAEVSADDMSVVLTTDAPLVATTSLIIDDTGAANTNGRLDPGETVDLVFTFRNFGEPATGLVANLTCSDPRITVLSGVADLPDLATGESGDHAATPFTVAASGEIPDGTPMTFDLLVSYDGGSAPLEPIIVIGQYHYLVWDPEPAHTSGVYLHQILGEVGYEGHLTTELPGNLDLYRCLFVCCGFYSENHVIAENSPEAMAIEGFAAAGGCVYLEGGDTWNYDPLTGGHDFGPLFGIIGNADGTGDMNTAMGVNGTFTQGMAIPFIASSSYVDHLTPTSGAYAIFTNSSPVYTCGVARDAGTYKTIGMSFTFGGLADFDPPSTRADLARGIMEFFLEVNPLAAPETPSLAASVSAFPNPFNPQTTIEFTNPRAGQVELAVFDVRGQRIAVLESGELAAGRHTVTWDGRDEAGRRLGSGVYLARLITGEESRSRKLMLVK